MIETSPPWTVSAAAERFVGERQAEANLEAIVELTAQVFSDARRIAVDLHEDPDVPELRWVVIRAEVLWDDAARARQARDEWYTRTAETLPAAALVDFGLEIDRRPE